MWFGEYESRSVQTRASGELILANEVNYLIFLFLYWKLQIQDSDIPWLVPVHRQNEGYKHSCPWCKQNYRLEDTLLSIVAFPLSAFFHRESDKILQNLHYCSSPSAQDISSHFYRCHKHTVL